MPLFAFNKSKTRRYWNVGMLVCGWHRNQLPLTLPEVGSVSSLGRMFQNTGGFTEVCRLWINDHPENYRNCPSFVSVMVGSKAQKHPPVGLAFQPPFDTPTFLGRIVYSVPSGKLDEWIQIQNPPCQDIAKISANLEPDDWYPDFHQWTLGSLN